ncbi:MAG TPA: GIY-YIG nuclease family protein [Bacteroidetes bacterium]|nr:GIY-YIG nuclease family protein [Bacteroidota bacterium]
MFSVYILWSEKLQIYYIGQTSDLDKRLQRHNRGYEKFTRKGIPWMLVWSTKKSSRREAVQLERKLKNYSVKRLRIFMDKYDKGQAGVAGR